MRLIARLDIKNEYVIKGINLEGLRKIGDPLTIAKEYYQKNEGNNTCPSLWEIM